MKTIQAKRLTQGGGHQPFNVIKPNVRRTLAHQMGMKYQNIVLPH